MRTVPAQAKQPLPNDAPITKNLVVAAFIEGVHSLGNEVDAWRRFGADVSEFLKAKGLTEEFQVWNEARSEDRGNMPQPVKRGKTPRVKR